MKKRSSAVVAIMVLAAGACIQVAIADTDDQQAEALSCAAIRSLGAHEDAASPQAGAWRESAARTQPEARPTTACS